MNTSHMPTSPAAPETVKRGDLEELIYGWIRDAEAPITTSEMLDRNRDHPLRRSGVLTGELLRRIVWCLVDAGRVEYDIEWKLRPRNIRGAVDA